MRIPGKQISRKWMAPAFAAITTETTHQLMQTIGLLRDDEVGWIMVMMMVIIDVSWDKVVCKSLKYVGVKKIVLILKTTQLINIKYIKLKIYWKSQLEKKIPFIKSQKHT